MFSSVRLLRYLVFLALFGLGLAQAAWQETALELLRNGRDDEARQLLLQVVDRDPVNEEAHALLGQIAFDQKQYQEATTHFAKSPSVLEENPLLLVNYAECLLETKAGAAALRALERVPQRDAVAQFESGALLARFGEYQAAESHLQLAKDYPNPYPVAYNLALTQYHLGKFRECAVTLEEIRTRFKTNDVLNLLGLAYLELGEFKKALETLQEGMRNNPLDERNYVAAAKLAAEAQKAALGLQILDRGLRYSPESYPLLMQRGYLRLLQGQYTDAEHDYRTAMEIQTDSSRTRLGLAFVFMASQRHSEAAAMAKEAIKLNSSSALAHFLIGELLIIGGVRPGTPAEEEAVSHLEKAVSLQPRFAVAHVSLGKLYLKRKELSLAIQEFKRAIQDDPSETAAYYQLSVAYRKKGEKEKALEALSKVQTLNAEERKMGKTQLLYQKLRRAGEGVLFPSGGN